MSLVLILSLLAMIAGDPTVLTARDHILSPRTETPALHYPITEQQALAAKAALLAYLPAAHPEARTGASGSWSEDWRPAIWRKIGTYHLLYAGVNMSWNAPGESRMSATGVRQVRITGICDDIVRESPSVLADAIITDGGECVFTAYFDPAQKKIVHFSVAGIA
jgi:hypothetical protein